MNQLSQSNGDEITPQHLPRMRIFFVDISMRTWADEANTAPLDEAAHVGEDADTTNGKKLPGRESGFVAKPKGQSMTALNKI